MTATATTTAAGRSQIPPAASPRAGGQHGARGDGSVSTENAGPQNMTHPGPPVTACPTCGQPLKRRRGRPGASPDLQRFVAALRAEGLTLASVAAELERRRIPTVQGGERWRASSVRAVLARAEKRGTGQNDAA